MENGLLLQNSDGSSQELEDIDYNMLKSYCQDLSFKNLTTMVTNLYLKCIICYMISHYMLHKMIIA